MLVERQDEEIAEAAYSSVQAIGRNLNISRSDDRRGLRDLRFSGDPFGARNVLDDDRLAEDSLEMAETLETLAAKIGALANTFTERFDGIDTRFDGIDTRLDGVDKRFDGLRDELLVRIEAVDAKVDLVLEQVGHLVQRDVANSVAHAKMEARLDNHELRITALEQPPKPS